jgi:hypothetical protein
MFWRHRSIVDGAAPALPTSSADRVRELSPPSYGAVKLSGLENVSKSGGADPV